MMKFPSVSKILNKTQSFAKRQSLEQWRNRIGDEEAQLIVSQAKVRGDYIHALIDHTIKNNKMPTNYDPDLLSILDVEKYWNNLQPVLNQISQPMALNNPIIHGDLDYLGYYDLLAYWDDKLSLIDFKTKTKPVLENWLEDDFIQLAAYVGAIKYNYPKLKIEQAIIVSVNPDGKQIFILEKEALNNYWNLWCDRLIAFGKAENLVNNWLALA